MDRGENLIPHSLRISSQAAVRQAGPISVRRDGLFHLILTMMRSCASAAKLRAAGPFSRSASSARFEYGFPPPRIVNSTVVLKPARAAENDANWSARFLV